MKYNIEVYNQHNVNEVLAMLWGIEQLDVLEINAIEDNSEFYKINYKDRTGLKCSFSLWIEKVNGDKLFFNIGDPEKEATICHFIDITSSTSIEELKDILSVFLKSDVLESRIFCQKKLKKIKYKILNSRFSSEFSYLHESYFFCFNKCVKTKKFESWLSF